MAENDYPNASTMKEIMAQRVQEENAQMGAQNAALSEQAGGGGNAMSIM